MYSNKTAAAVIRMIAEDFQLNVGALADTGYTIASRVEDNKTLFDIIQTALDETLKATSQMYVLYDDVGKLTLKNIGDMKLGLLVDNETAGDFDYKTSIASQTYDKVKLSYENKDTGKREIFIAQDGSSINQWGVLQYYEKIDSTANAKAMADALLSLYNTKTRTLKPVSYTHLDVYKRQHQHQRGLQTWEPGVRPQGTDDGAGLFHDHLQVHRDLRHCGGAVPQNRRNADLHCPNLQR